MGRAAVVPAVRDDEAVSITIGGVTQRVRAVATTDAPVSSASRDVVAVLRPEALTLASPDDAGVWTGEVVARRFPGAVTAFHVRLADASVVAIQSAGRALREAERLCAV